MAKKKAIIQAKVNNKETELTKLLKNKGYKKINESTTNETYLAIDPVTGEICLILANQGSQFFKEMVLPDNVVDYLFSLSYEKYEYKAPEKEIKPSVLAQCFIDNQKYEYINYFERDVKELKIEHESLIRVMKEEKVISILQISFINKTFTNITNINLTFEEVFKITEYIVNLALEKTQNEQEKEKKEEEK